LSTALDFSIGSRHIVVAGGHPIRKDTDVNIVPVGRVSSERTTDAKYFIVRMCDNTKYGHASTYQN
jgi:hypothetical protein